MTLIVIFYFLVSHPDELAKLRTELHPLAKPPYTIGDDNNATVPFPSEKLAPLKHLNGIINESLRLYPVIPSATYRKAPPQGISIAGTFIPGNTDV